MAYTKQTWENLPSQTTPINADRLTHIEDGIFNAAATADTAASNASSAISGLADKVDKVDGKGLSTNDFTDALKTKLDNIETGAEVNVQADYAQTNTEADDYIKNKPSLGTSAYKNSTSVITQSTDLVESGAVKDIIGWVNKNLLNPATLGLYDATGASAMRYGFAPITLKAGTYTFSYGALETNVNAYITNITNNYAQLSVPTDTKELTFTLTVESSIFVRTSASASTVITNAQLEKGPTATTYEPYHASVEQTMRDAQFIQGKNYLPNDITTQTVNGVTFAVQEDGTVIANGTASADWARVYFANNTYLPVGNYLLSGVTGGATTTYRITLEMSDGTSVTVFDGNTAFTITEGKYINKAAILIRQAGYVANNVVFKPMVRKATETDPTYEPYYIPLKDVVPTKADNSVIGTVEDGTTASQAYAVGSHFIRDGAFCTCIQAIAQGGSFTLNTNYTAGNVADCLIKWAEFTGTTSAAGNLTVDNVGNKIILSAYTTNATNTLAFPFKLDSPNRSYVQIRNRDTMAVVGETEFSIKYFYIEI